MTTAWTYRAVNSAGRAVRGTADAEDQGALARTLEGRGLLLVRAEPRSEAAATGQARGFGVHRELAEATRALAALLPAGLPLVRALTAARAVSRGTVAEALDQVRAAVERGDAPADALAQRPDVFPAHYVGVVRAGERSGDLDNAFARLAAQLEREERLRSRLVSAAIYPLILLVLGGLAVTVLLFFVIPRFGELLEGAGASLPATTSALLAVTNALGRGWPLILVLGVAGAVTLVALAKTPRGRRAMARLALDVPVIGRVRRSQLAGRTARLLGVLLDGGAPLYAALADAAHSVGDPWAATELTRVRERVRQGASLNEALREGGTYPDLLSQLVQVGEDSGRLTDFLLKSATLFEERTERQVERLVTLIEPAMIVAFGVIVAFIALSLFQAIYGVNAGSFR